MKIGVVSDTHLQSGGLPKALVDRLQGVDMILHAGDVVTLQPLRQLERIAPVEAVQGNMDWSDVRSSLPNKAIIEVSGHRIGLIHGHGVPNPGQVLPPPINFEALHAYLLSEFEGEEVDCIVYGHTHHSYVGWYQGVLMVNPGSATGGGHGRGTLAILTVTAGQLDAEIVELP
jgi:putative phosphoesterase